MELLRVDPADPDPRAIARAAEVLLAGGLVALPTETVYGLAALADDPDAISRVYAAKGRPPNNPLIVHVADADAARAASGDWPAAADRLAERFWPGPLSIVVPKGAGVVDAVTAGLATQAVRAPDHPVARAVLRAVGRPLAAPSANRSERLSPTAADHVVAALGDAVDLVLDAGPCRVGLESTVVDVSRTPPRLLRPGAVPRARLRTVLPDLAGPADDEEPTGGPARSPGRTPRHYAPRARLVVGDRARLARAADNAARPLGLLLRSAPADLGADHGPDHVADHVRTLPADPEGYATGLYAALHALDDAGCATVLVEAPPDDAAWEAVRDRLRRARG